MVRVHLNVMVSQVSMQFLLLAFSLHFCSISSLTLNENYLFVSNWNCLLFVFFYCIQHFYNCLAVPVHLLWIKTLGLSTLFKGLTLYISKVAYIFLNYTHVTRNRMQSRKHPHKNVAEICNICFFQMYIEDISETKSLESQLAQIKLASK